MNEVRRNFKEMVAVLRLLDEVGRLIDVPLELRRTEPGITQFLDQIDHDAGSGLGLGRELIAGAGLLSHGVVLPFTGSRRKSRVAKGNMDFPNNL